MTSWARICSSISGVGISSAKTPTCSAESFISPGTPRNRCSSLRKSGGSGKHRSTMESFWDFAASRMIRRVTAAGAILNLGVRGATCSKLETSACRWKGCSTTSAHTVVSLEVGSETQGAPEHRAQPAPPGCRGDGFAAWSAGPEAWGRAGRRTLAGWRQRGRPLACRHGRSCTTFRRWRRGALPHRPAGTDLGRRRRRGLPQHHPPDACGRWGRRGVPHWHPAAAPRRRRRR
mmetsp:Transcript_56599/g.150945  ORF Transcript_56599/g.150945 Transcript_56599/m.150945 type:complete len:233 (+) Transcript_56599:1147-1845(+)